MYSIEKTYKFEIEGKIFYTGRVLEEDSLSIKIETIRNEILILNKQNIVQSRELNCIGERDGKN